MHIDQPDWWQERYQRGQTGWDLGRPTPLFQRLLDDGALPTGRMIVLGAGRGADARLFARHGFEVVAVDFAADAVQAMHDRAQPDAPLTIVHADMFDLPAQYGAEFDYVLEYTSFCALNPQRRAEYADLVAHLLKPGGTLIALLFPIGDYAGGPPFAIDPEQFIALFEAHHFTIVERSTPPDSVASRRGREQLVVLRR